MKRIVFLFAICVYSTALFSQITIAAVTEVAQKGDINAQKYLGEAYFYGKYGAEKNLEESYKWYLAAAKQDDTEAQYNVAEVLFRMNRNETEEEFYEKMNWLKKSADNGYAPAQVKLADFLSDAEGLERNTFDYYYRAAQQSYSPAYIKLADCYRDGIGTVVNLTEAKHLYELAISEANEPMGYIGLAVCAGKEQDYTKTREYFQQGIEAEVPVAYYYMAWLYAMGRGVSKDFKEAHRLIDIYIGKNPRYIDGIESKGEFYLMEGNMDKAQELWNKFVELNPNYLQSNSTFAQAMMNSIDSNIPQSSLKSEKTFALVIANEDYKRVSPVPFAKNDGSIFAEYCKKTLGVPEKNVYLVENATLGDIKYHINQMKKIADAFNGEARLIFYYAGHGIPDESQRTSYLLPVDGYGNDATSGYSLESLYAELASIPARSTLVFMDACFSGAQRDGSMMVEARGVAIKPKEEMPTGKLVVFSAAQGDETAFPYTEKKHGMFTYFLLKKLQDTKGDTTLGELMDYVTTEVKQQSVLQNRKSQTPKVTASQSVADTWKNMTLK